MPAGDFNIVDTVDDQRSEKGQIHDSSHIAAHAVLQWKHRGITASVFYGLVSFTEIGIPNGGGIRKNPQRCQMSKGTGNTTEGHIHSGN